MKTKQLQKNQSYTPEEIIESFEGKPQYDKVLKELEQQLYHIGIMKNNSEVSIYQINNRKKNLNARNAKNYARFARNKKYE